MISKLTELEIVQNPALGAYSIWHFGQGFQTDDGRSAPLPLAFLVLPLLFHGPTLGAIGSTRKASGLALFVARLGEEQEQLVAVHERALRLRQLTLESIAMGIQGKLLSLDYKQATLRANVLIDGAKKPLLPERLKSLPSCADKVGYWFSKSGLSQVARSLKVEF